MNSITEGFIHSSDLTIALQPVFDIESGGSVSFFESTLRVTGTPDPSLHIHLLSIAERLGFIDHIDLHVLGLTVEVLRRHPTMCASINVSQRSILEEGQQLLRRLAASQVSERIIVEITESAEIPSAWVSIFAAGVREVGCQVAVDDFETGYADDVLVRAVRPHLIKVVIDDTTRHYRERIGRTIELAREVGAQVVGEKIDTDEKIALAQMMGIRYLQGFSLATPVFQKDLAAYLRTKEGSMIAIDQGSTPGIRPHPTGRSQAIHGDRKIGLVEETRR